MVYPGVEVVRAVALNVLAALQLAPHYYPEAGVVKDGDFFDYIIVGGGTAGCILANRLTENPDITVALIETGGQQPLESVRPGMYPLVPGTNYDFNFYTQQDKYSAQELEGKSARLTSGKMLGGSSSLNPMFHSRSNRLDFDNWVKATGDESWNFDEMLRYYIKSERLEDEEILNSPQAALHGVDGPVGISRQPFPTNENIIRSFQQLGYTFQIDLDGNTTLGIAEPLLQISDGVRQSMSEAYLLPIKDRPNLAVYTQTTATRVIFDCKTAIGVEVINCKNESVYIYSDREVILSAGAIKTAQLLLLSGVGPQATIETWGIESVIDLPVARAVLDQVASVFAYKMKPSNKPTPPFDPKKFPVATTTTLKSLGNSEYPEYRTVNMYFPQNSPSLSPICSNDLMYNDDVCDRFVAANEEGDLFLSMISHLYPQSRGKVALQSEDPLADPWIYMGTFLDPDDLEKLAAYVEDHAKVVKTRYFRARRAEIVDLDLYYCNHLPKDCWDYWKCHARSMSTLSRHTAGSAPMGTVLDSKLNVIGLRGLRVVDAAAIPSLSSGGIVSDVIVLAEKAADIIKADQ